jgi:hypothetical protein
LIDRVHDFHPMYSSFLSYVAAIKGERGKIKEKKVIIRMHYVIGNLAFIWVILHF